MNNEELRITLIQMQDSAKRASDRIESGEYAGALYDLDWIRSAIDETLPNIPEE